MRGARAAALFLIVLIGAAGCGHSRWPAKTLGDGATINLKPIVTTVDRLRKMPRPAGVDDRDAARVAEERQVYRVDADLLRFTLASDGDIHLAIAQPGHPQDTMIAEIPDPSRMTGAPNIYRLAVARTRREFIAEFGTPVMSTWKPANREVTLYGPLFFDLLHGQTAGLFGGTPTGIEIHPVLGITISAASGLRGHNAIKPRVGVK
ncbi:MAG TPA: hypothetical protein VFO29_01245 [Candidatus Rubrimentiphilum sp.]|nr:hypothetical protein [Candidatus Rubrimentiphilum sp.]